MFVIAAFSLQTIIQLNCQLTGLSFTNNCCTTSLLTDRPPGSEPGGGPQNLEVHRDMMMYTSVCVSVSVSVCG